MFRPLVFLGITLFLTVVPAWSELTHKVEKGETLFAISREYGVSLKQLQDANPGLEPQSLKVGKTVRIPETPGHSTPSPAAPGPTSSSPSPAKITLSAAKAVPAIDVPKGAYRVQPGDTISKIAQDFNVTTTQLRVWNDLPSDRVVLGHILRVTPPNVAATPFKKTFPVVARAASIPVTTKPADPAPVEPPDKSERYFFVSKVKDEIDNAKVEKGRWKYIVVHHSGTKNGNLKIFDYYHRHRGMETASPIILSSATERIRATVKLKSPIAGNSNYREGIWQVRN